MGKLVRVLEGERARMLNDRPLWEVIIGLMIIWAILGALDVLRRLDRRKFDREGGDVKRDWTFEIVLAFCMLVVFGGWIFLAGGGCIGAV